MTTAQPTIQPTHDWYIDIKRFYLAREDSEPETGTEQPDKVRRIPITLRRIQLDKLPGLPDSSIRPNHARLSISTRHGTVRYCLSARKLTPKPRWTNDQPLEYVEAEEYTPVESLTKERAVYILRHWTGHNNPLRLLDLCQTLPPGR